MARGLLSLRVSICDLLRVYLSQAKMLGGPGAPLGARGEDAESEPGRRDPGLLLKPSGLTAAQAEVVAVLRDAPAPLTVREIGERLMCEGGSPSRLVASVVATGLVERGERAGDR